MTEPTDLEGRCDALRSLHVPGTPLVLPNAWDAASARAVEAAGFPVVATTSRAVAPTLGYEDHERAPGEEMLAAAARIAAAVNIPVTVDAEAGYGTTPSYLVARLKAIGAAGCNLEDTNHATGELGDPAEQADWLRAVRGAASDQGYGLVINARIGVFVSAIASGKGQAELVGQALQRAHAYAEAGADCVFPILLWEPDALEKLHLGRSGPRQRSPDPADPYARQARRTRGGTNQLRRSVARRRDGALRPPSRIPARRLARAGVMRRIPHGHANGCDVVSRKQNTARRDKERQR